MLKSDRARREGSMRFQITRGSGHTVAIDDVVGDSAPQLAELLISAQAGCTALGQRWPSVTGTTAGVAG